MKLRAPTEGVPKMTQMIHMLFNCCVTANMWKAGVYILGFTKTIRRNLSLVSDSDIDDDDDNSYQRLDGRSSQESPQVDPSSRLKRDPPT